MRKAIFLAIGGVALLAGCGNQGDKAPGIPIGPKWKGAPYRISFDKAADKPNAAGITLPVVKYTANPDALERRAILVVRLDTSELKTDRQIPDQMVMAPIDVSGAEGALPADYMAAADKGLAEMLGAYCVKGKVKLTVALARSSLNNQAGSAEVDSKRLSDWQPVELVYKNPHPKC